MLILAVLVVAGCTAAPTEGEPTPSQTATPEPTEPALTAPRSALPLTCDELYGLAELQPQLAEPVQVRKDESSAPLGVRAAQAMQSGALECVFGGDSRTDSSYDYGLSILVFPAAGAAFDSYRASEAGAGLLGYARLDTLGDRSMLTCQGSEMFGSAESPGDTFICGGDFVVGDYWVTARLSDRSDLLTDAAYELATAVMQTVAARIAEAGSPRALWIPPTGADPAALCSDPAAATALLGVDASTLAVEITPEYRAAGVPLLSCQWTTESTGLRLTALQSGAWAFDRVEATPGMTFHGWLRPSERFDIEGTDGALVTCIDACYGFISWEGSLIQISFDEPTFDPVIAAERLQAWGAALP